MKHKLPKHREKPSIRLERCQKAIEEKPDSAVAHYNMGLAYAAVGKLIAAEKSYLRATELDPSLTEAWVNLGGVRLLLWNFEGCLEATEKAVGLRADLPMAHHNMGQAYLYLNDPENLVRCTRRVLELERDNAAAHYFAAVGLLATGDVGGAERHLSRAVELGHRPTPQLIKALDAAVQKRARKNVNLIEISGVKKAPENKKEE
jgi:tetratricopeptide (TPR) repeat protein